ncbi:hypothetical protein [Bradyrhizobium elkanii]|uniref:hypothetical protein n=1 Tax=Bradyrhizobium elkanii TaxID=29448 RepID=UPI0014498BFB|nr:hypothetical protein [Bradyrhizobium elkanii]MCS3585643.1 hypothetical protein [Bradyrhizobium elkanii]MCS3724938.1 hypothetical protein [Bradyrhizobium elkanii]MCS4012368.1 hypothetical protein [Bradyrhizobium elkanii USDA 61]BBC03838.1 hypothetical protein BE61_p0110 [Bradyrhizobium elkanii USDA 61]
MTIDTIEELRAELRDCLFSAAERKALETQLAELIRLRNQPTTSGDASPADQTLFIAGA